MLDFENNIEYFRQRGVEVVAASADTKEHALDTIRMYGLSYRVAYGLVPRDVSARIGAFYSAEEGHLHATGFVIDASGKVFNGVYSTRSIGRLAAKDCIGLIDFSR